MKNFVKYVLQNALGYQLYLNVFSRYKIKTLKADSKEKDFFAFMGQIHNEGDILDVGANIGIMTYHLAKRFPDRKVLAIEPMPENFSVLKSVVDRNGLKNVELIPVAVGEKKETLEMVLPKNGKVKMQGLAHVVHESIDEWNDGDKIEVLCERLDDIAGDRVIAGIKMDVENFEYFALKGGERMIIRDRPVIYLELWENKNRDLCFEFLRLKHYKIYIILDGQLVPFDPASHKKQNFICKYEKERPVLLG